MISPLSSLSSPPETDIPKTNFSPSQAIHKPQTSSSKPSSLACANASSLQLSYPTMLLVSGANPSRITHLCRPSGGLWGRTHREEAIWCEKPQACKWRSQHVWRFFMFLSGKRLEEFQLLCLILSEAFHYASKGVSLFSKAFHFLFFLEAFTVMLEAFHYSVNKVFKTRASYFFWTFYFSLRLGCARARILFSRNTMQ